MSAAVSLRVLHCKRKACRSLVPPWRGLPPWPKRAWFSVDSDSSGGLTPRGRDPDFQLSDAEVGAILRANEQSVRFPESDGRGPAGPVLGFESNQLAANVPAEDRRAAAACLLTRGSLFGVFDGHCGHACAQTLSERLLYYAAVALTPRGRLEALEAAATDLRPLPPVLRWHKHHNDYNYRASAFLHLEHLRAFWLKLLAEREDREGAGGGPSPRDALDRAFCQLDADISREARAPPESARSWGAALEAAFSGSTACVAYVDGEGVHVANAGDCRAVLGARGEDGGWSALALSRDHNAWNGEELARVRARHPESERNTVVADDRLLGALMPLRAFGDVRFKWSLELQRNVLESSRDLDLDIYEYTLPNYLTPPYLEATPELTYHRLRPGDHFLILASDGLWETLDSEGAVRLVGEHLMASALREAGPAPALDANSATHLIRHAIGTDEYGEVDPERSAAMLALPEEAARMYRDDITVTVVYFSHPKQAVAS